MHTYHQSIKGRHWETGDWIRIEFDEKQIIKVSKEVPESTNQQWLAPGLFDLQVNGYGGVDFQQQNLSEQSLIHACKSLKNDGCPRFLLTLTTSKWSIMLGHLKRIKSIRDANPALSESIVGWHIEGPFLSEESGYCGAHDIAVMEDPCPKKIDALKDITKSDPTLITLAPERNGSMESIRHATQLGIRISLGHTNADSFALSEAKKAGATGFTHLGNACPQNLDRHNNLIYRVLDSGNWMTGLIPDGIHLPPALFRIFHKLIPSDQIYYTTDAMSAAGAVPGKYKIGKIEVEVGEDQIVRQPGRSNFAGSALKPYEGIIRAAKMLNVSWRDVWHHSSMTPAHWMHLPLGLSPGSPSQFSIIKESLENGIQIQVNQPHVRSSQG